jgi:hypothetical protein
MRTNTLREYAAAAGFHSAVVHDLEHDALRFYRLTQLT